VGAAAGRAQRFTALGRAGALAFAALMAEAEAARWVITWLNL
jgi:hypothetical protein